MIFDNKKFYLKIIFLYIEILHYSLFYMKNK